MGLLLTPSETLKVVVLAVEVNCFEKVHQCHQQHQKKLFFEALKKVALFRRLIISF